MPPILRLLFPNNDCLHVLRLILLENNDYPETSLVLKIMVASLLEAFTFHALFAIMILALLLL